MLFSIEGHQAKQKQKRKKTRKTKERLTQGRKLQSHRPNWNTSLEASQGTTETKANHWSMSCPCYTYSIPAGWPRGPLLGWQAASAEHDAKNWEVYWYPQTSAKTKSLTWMPTAEKAVKERGCTQMPVAKKERKNRPQMTMAKKERPNHKWWWQTIFFKWLP